MFSGKSNALKNEIERAGYAKKNVVIIKPRSDDMYGEHNVGTHDGWRKRAIAIDRSRDVFEHVRRDTDLLCIDEYQHFPEDMVGIVLRLVSLDVNVSAFGLMLDFAGRLMGHLHVLAAYSDHFEMLTAVCVVCGSEYATRSQRFNDSGEPAEYGDGVFLPGEKYYEARCRHCLEVPGAPASPYDDFVL